MAAPRARDVLGAAALQARTSVEAVEKSALPCFSDEAATLATFFGSPEKAVQACLAKIAGYEAGKPPDRSLLTNTENYVTCLYAAGLQIHSISYVWNFLRSLPPDVCDAFKGMQLVADSDGAVFDVPAKHKAQLEGLDGIAVGTCRTAGGSRSARPSPRAGAAAGAAAAGAGAARDAGGARGRAVRGKWR